VSDMKLIMENWKRYVSENEDSGSDSSADIDWRFPWKSLPPDELETMLNVYVEDPLSQEMLPEIAYHPQIVKARKEWFTAQWEKCSGNVADIPMTLGYHEADEELIKARQALADAISQRDRMIGGVENFEDIKGTPELVSLNDKIAALQDTVTSSDLDFRERFRGDYARRRAATGGIGGGGHYGCRDWFMGSPTLSKQLAKWEKFWGVVGPGRAAQWGLRDQKAAADAKRREEKRVEREEKKAEHAAARAKEVELRKKDTTDRRASRAANTDAREREIDRRDAKHRAARRQRQRDQEERSPSFSPSPLPLKE
jgi:hypothetical protein